MPTANIPQLWPYYGFEEDDQRDAALRGEIREVLKANRMAEIGPMIARYFYSKLAYQPNNPRTRMMAKFLQVPPLRIELGPDEVRPEIEYDVVENVDVRTDEHGIAQIYVAPMRRRILLPKWFRDNYNSLVTKKLILETKEPKRNKWFMKWEGAQKAPVDIMTQAIMTQTSVYDNSSDTDTSGVYAWNRFKNYPVISQNTKGWKTNYKNLYNQEISNWIVGSTTNTYTVNWVVTATPTTVMNNINYEVYYNALYNQQTGVWDNPDPTPKGLRIVPRRRKDVGPAIDPAEQKARNTLRDMLSEREFRRYITNGFVMVKGPSGFWYQIFHRLSGHVIHVYKNNRDVGTLCIQTDGKCPPTDHVLNMMIMVEYDEPSVWTGANQNGFKDVAPLVKIGSQTTNVLINGENRPHQLIAVA